MELETLTAISPLDGRYRSRIEQLAQYASEYGLMRYRVRVEIEWFLHLSQTAAVQELPAFDSATTERCLDVWRDFSIEGAQSIRDIERTTNHDVKAVEYYVKSALASIGLRDHTEFVHFACTSEDINNLSYGLMLNDIRDELLLPQMQAVTSSVRDLASSCADVPMLSRTHGQPASPTTVGKELANFVHRLERRAEELRNVEILGKMNGAVGNFNAHVVAYPNVDWPGTARSFIEGLGFAMNPMTTQIEPHDYIDAFFNAASGFNQILLDFARDVWSYIAIGYFKQRKVEGETGSSTMPHKVNPIDFENAEGNVGLANAVADHLGAKLTVSRWQRDLSDSTVLRSIGTSAGYSLVAYASLLKGMSKLEVDTARIRADLADSWEVLAEAVQTVMRRIGAEEPYEKLKEMTRGRHFDEQVYRELLAQLDLSDDVRRTLESLTPETYIGLAAQLARQTTGE